jgi:hypothetical protein
MLSLEVNLPFKVHNLLAGFAEGNGLAKARPSELTLEFVIKDSLINLFRSNVKEIRIPQSEIDSIRHKPGLFGDRVRIRVKSLKLLEQLPGCTDGEVTLHVARRNRAEAGNLVQLLGCA